MMSFDFWLTTDTEAERCDAAQYLIDEQTKYLVKNNANYDHTLFENFSMDVYSATAEQAESIEEYLKARDFEKLGRLVWAISVEAREKHAQVQAKTDWENGDLDD